MHPKCIRNLILGALRHAMLQNLFEIKMAKYTI